MGTGDSGSGNAAEGPHSSKVGEGGMAGRGLGRTSLGLGEVGFLFLLLFLLPRFLCVSTWFSHILVH